MKKPVKTGLPVPSAPIEWATLVNNVLYTAQIPIKADGSIESGDIRTQTRLTFDNLKQTLAAAGGTLLEVAQVLVYLPDPKDFPGMNEDYGQYFRQTLSEPRDDRGTAHGTRRPHRDRRLCPYCQEDSTDGCGPQVGGAQGRPESFRQT